MISYAEITWNGTTLELLSDKEESRIQGEKAGGTKTVMESCSRTLETALEGLSRNDLV